MTAFQLLDALIDVFIPRIRKAFLAAIQDIVDEAIINEMIKAIQNGDVEAAFRAVGYSDAAMRPLTAVIEQAYEEGGVLTGKTFPKRLSTPNGKTVFRFDVRNSRAEAWLRDKSSTLITRIEEDTRKNVQSALTIGMEQGRNPRNVALDIVGRIDPSTGKRSGGLVGLSANQEGWVRSARAKLVTLDERYFDMELRDKRFDSTVRKAIERDEPLSAETIDKLIGRYRDNSLKWRGDNIARTEAMQSLNAAEWEATKQAVDIGAVLEQHVRREWDDAGDKRVRFSHRRLNKQTVGLNEPFVSPVTGAKMMHPGDTSLGAGADEVAMCRCRVRSKIDWLADLD
jgi:hypothetical protein